MICIVSLDFVEVENTKQKMKKLDKRLQHCDGKVIVEKIYDRFTTPNKLIKTKKKYWYNGLSIMDTHMTDSQNKIYKLFLNLKP